TTSFVTNAVSLKASLDSPTFTGTPALPTGTTGVTQSADNNSTKLATTAYVDREDALKADLASPTFSGTPKAPTASVGTNTTQVATTAFVKSTIEASTVTLGKAGTSDGNGVRIGNGRFVVNKPTSPTTTSSNSNSETLTVSQVLDAGIYIFTPSSSKSLTFPSAADLVSALPNATVGDTFTMLIMNESGSNSFTLNAGTGITIVPTTKTISSRSSRVIYFRLTNVGSSSEAISIYY
ncbi:MAG: Ralstonia phage phiRSL1, partial [Bacteroidota bacterium]